ncbi:hypothetical protein Bca4012_009319 [Brassica carinata]
MSSDVQQGNTFHYGTSKFFTNKKRPLHILETLHKDMFLYLLLPTKGTSSLQVPLQHHRELGLISLFQEASKKWFGLVPILDQKQVTPGKPSS